MPHPESFASDRAEWGAIGGWADDSEVDAAIDLGQHADEPFQGEPLHAAVAKVGHTAFVDTEQVCGDDGREVVDETKNLVAELLSERRDRRFDGVAGHAGEFQLILVMTVIKSLPR